MHVFAGKIRLLRGLAIGQVPFDLVGVRVHAAFDVRHVLEVAVVHAALVMHGTVRIDLMHMAVHRAEHLACEGFVAERPDEHARMVVIAAQHAVDAVHARALPFGLAAGNGVLGRLHVVRDPAAVRLQIGLVDQIDAVFVAQVVPVFLVRIMRSADGVDVVALAEHDVVDHVLPGDRASALRVEFVAVRALEHHAPAVKRHDAVLDAERAEADLLRDGFDGAAIRAGHADRQLIQRRFLRAPRRDGLQRIRCQRGFRGGVLLRFPDDRAVRVVQLRDDLACLVRIAQLKFRVERARACGRIPIGLDLHVLDMRAGLCHELDRTEQAVQTPEVLVFQPGRAGIFEACDDERMLRALVAVQYARDVEFIRRETVLAVADEHAVEPYVDRGGHAMEDEIDGAIVLQVARQRLAERETATVDRDVVVVGNVRLLRVLMAIPWVLHVDVLVLEVSSHLQVPRHVDAAEIVGRVARRGERRVLHIDLCGLRDAHVPFAVEALRRIGGFPDGIPMIGMRRFAVHRENRRVGEPVRAGLVCLFDCCCHRIAPCVTASLPGMSLARHK